MHANNTISYAVGLPKALHGKMLKLFLEKWLVVDDDKYSFKLCLFFLIRICVLVNLGIHNSPLDGSHLQIETSKEQDSREDQKIEIGEHEGLMFASTSLEIET